MYEEGVFITEIAVRTGFGTTTIFRWAQEAGIARPLSERLAAGSGGRQFGHERIGKKGVFHTTKGGAWIHTDSTYEYARLEQLEARDDVALLKRCELRVPYVINGRRRTYTPDFHVETVSGEVFIEEVKPARWIDDDEVKAKAAAAMSACERMGARFRIVTEHDIGLALIASVYDAAQAARSPAAVAAAAERRKGQRRVAQRRLMEKFKASASPEQMAEYRAKASAYQQAARLRKKQSAR